MIYAPVAALAGGPPPNPSKTSTVGLAVNNPVTGQATTVSALVVDPVGTPTAGSTAFVQTADGYIFMVKAVGETVYNGDNPQVPFTILSKDTTAHTVQLMAPGQLSAVSLPYEVLSTDPNIQALLFPPADASGIITPPVVVAGASGVRFVSIGAGGSGGRDGALFVRPNGGGDGAPGPSVSYATTVNISTTNQIGIETGSLGGRGGKGGDSYLSFWGGADGGNGGAGGSVTVTNAPVFQIATTGANMHGIFAYSLGGAAGDGGSGYAAPGGGTGGHSSNGGPVTVTNNGRIVVVGEGAFGIYGLSVSNTGCNALRRAAICTPVVGSVHRDRGVRHESPWSDPLLARGFVVAGRVGRAGARRWLARSESEALDVHEAGLAA